jgi:hypothetical protein
MPIDLMSLVEGGAATPGKRPSGSGSLLANKELMAQFEKKAAPDTPLEPQVPRKKWTPPPKPETEYQKAAQANEGRMPWDPPVRKSSWEQKSTAAPTSPAPKIVANAPASPTPVVFARANDPSGKEGDESPKSRLSDNPFMRRDSKEGMSPRSPAKKQDAYPVISTVERAEPEAEPDKPSTEKVMSSEHALSPSLSAAFSQFPPPRPPRPCPTNHPDPMPVAWPLEFYHHHAGLAPQIAEWAAVQQKAEARGGESTPPAEAAAKQEELTPAAEPQPTNALEPEPAPTPEPVPATVTAPTPDPGAAAEGTKAGGPTTAVTGPGPEGGEAEPPRSESLGKAGKKKSSMGSLFSALTPRSRRGSKDK